MISANRMLYLSFSLLMLAGVWLTGFETAHWLLYVPIVFSGFAGISGFCVNLWLWKKLGFRDDASCAQ
ncbi:MAG: hypothetical protein OQL09_07170 [Gammaproteobacteria bacterium]|nr:hypothetical protein [Gammaproteobacteria bacterium]